MASTPQPSEGGQQSLALLATIVAIFSKGVAGFAIALYASGFLVISLHHSKYGFAEVNPLRPRILAAGAWFLLFVSIPLVTVGRIKGTKNLTWMQFSRLLFPYYFACLTFGTFASILFDVSLFSTTGATPAMSVWIVGIVASLAIVGLVNSWEKVPPRVASIVSVALTLFFAGTAVHELVIANQFTVGAIGLWFFGMGVVTMLELNMRSKDADWSKSVFTICGALLVFASYYYPHLKSSWGGGSPVSVTIYFTKDSPIKPSQSVSAQLVDESDAGFYIVGQKDKKAVFVPRNAVSMTYFSDKVSDSALLK